MRASCLKGGERALMQADIGGGSGQRMATIMLSRFVPSESAWGGGCWPALRDGIEPKVLDPADLRVQADMQMGDEVRCCECYATRGAPGWGLGDAASHPDN